MMKSIQKYHKHFESNMFDIQPNVSRAMMAMLNVADQAIKYEAEGHTVSLKEVLNNTLKAVTFTIYQSNEISDKCISGSIF